MNTLEHLSKILPQKGLKVFAEMNQRKDKNGELVFKADGSPAMTFFHKTFTSTEELANRIRLSSRNGKHLFMAMGGFDAERSFSTRMSERTHKEYRAFSRSADYVTHARSIWIDLDCGEDKALKGTGYATQQDALAALEQMLEELNLPRPMLVDSGRGVHVYWTFTQDLPKIIWHKLARIVDACVRHWGLITDSQCTTDAARVLRPIGTINYKNNRTVTLIKDAPSIAMSTLADALLPYYKMHKAEIEAIKAKPVVEYVKKDNTAFSDKNYKVKPYLQKCQVAQFALIGKEPIEEPVWRGVISVIRHCNNGGRHIETLRSKLKNRFPETTRFDEDRTSEKLAWLQDHDIGPFTCASFQRECPKLCQGCPFASVVKTPLSLAEEYDEIEIPQLNIDLSASETTNNEVETQSNGSTTITGEIEYSVGTTSTTTPQPPYPYKRTANGIVVVKDEKETVFFRGDMFPVMTRFVEMVDGERNVMVKFMLRIGKSGTYQEVSFLMKDWYAADRIKQKLGSVGVSIPETSMQHLLGYMRKYLEHVEDDMDEIKQLQHFGWTDNRHFLLGEKLYRPDGVVTVQPHINIKNYTRHFKQSGTLDGWKQLMQRLQDLGAVEQQICMLSTFGSTLMKFTNYNGIWLHLMTKPGYGKTTTQEMMNGVWGKPHDLLLNAKDTLNAIEERFGRWANIGVTIDEVSNLDPKIASDLLLGVTQGRTKQRLDTNMRERVNDLTWNLIVLSSGNFSILDRMNAIKADIAAEISRTLEFKLPKPTLSVYEGETLIKKPIRDNYGVAGPAWLENLVRIPESTIDALISKATKAFSEELNASSEERFWITGCAVMYVAGELLNKMGLTNWDLTRIYTELCNLVKHNRNNRTTYEFSATDKLASFLADNVRNTAVVDVGIEPNTTMVRLTPTGQLNVRYEMDKGILYVRTQALKEYCSKQGVGVNSVKESLLERGLLESSSVRVTLSKGLSIETGRAVCIAIKVDEFTQSALLNMLEKQDE